MLVPSMRLPVCWISPRSVFSAASASSGLGEPHLHGVVGDAEPR